MSIATEKTIPHHFEECASLNKEKTALSCNGTTLNYDVLNSRANRLSHYLIEAGVKAGAHVGLCMERSLELVIAIVAISKTGAVYVPLDPQYPPERLSFILADADIKTLLTSNKCVGHFTTYQGNIVIPENLTDSLTSYDECNPSRTIRSEDKAYIMYTSGSTGTPKGVVIPHRGIIRLVRQNDYIDFSSDQVFVLLSSISFDASTFELWGALLNGAQCVIYSPELPTLSSLEKVLISHNVSVLWLTAALFNTVIDETPQILRRIKYLLTGGEALSPPHVRKALRELPETKLINGYGPTENTTFTCCYSIPPDFLSETASIPIGKPINGTQVYILNDGLEPVSQGETGELYIGGDGVALGYLNRPDLTATVFTPDPFSNSAGNFLYKSGDYTRLLADGNIEFIGRVDNQLKIKGFRVEPGEIERNLLECRGIKAVAVIPRRDLAAHITLVAYASIQPKSSLSSKDLKNYLKKRLPSYLVPDYVEVLESLPLNANGKIDRNSLAQRPLPTRNSYKKYPLTEYEKIAASMVQEILHTSHLSPKDNLLDHGADSLAVMLLISHLEEKGYSLNFIQFYTDPTISGIGRCIKNNPTTQNETKEYSAPARNPTRDSFPLSSPQKSIYFLDRLLPGNPAYRFQAALHLHGKLHIDILEQTITAVIAKHEILRTTFQQQSGKVHQRIHAPWEMKLQVKDIRCKKEQTYEEVVQNILAAPLQLDTLPLFHHTLIRQSDDHHILVIVEHHIIHDGHSFSTMIAELFAIYRSLRGTEEMELKRPQFQYADFALYEQSWLLRSECKKHEYFWKNYLAKAPEYLALPLDYPRPSPSAFKGEKIDVFLDHDLCRQLRTVSREQGISLFTLMLSAFFVLLHHLSKQTDIVVGTGVANRLAPGSQKVLGMFVNTIAVRAALSDEQSFTSLCRHLNTSVNLALQHQTLPFRKILAASGRKTSQGETPMVNTLFNFHDSSFPDLIAPELKGEIEYLHNDTAKFDINVIAIPEPEYCYQKSGGKPGMLLLWEYSTEIFSKSTMQNIIKSYTSLLDQLCLNPEKKLSSYALNCAGSTAHVQKKETDGTSRFQHFLKDLEQGNFPQTSSTGKLQAIGKIGNIYQEFKKKIQWPRNTKGLDSLSLIRRFTRKTAAVNESQSMNMTEHLMIELWQEILEVPHIHKTDNFFELGGDSLAAVILTSRIYQRTGMDFPVSSLFSNPTVEGLAQAMISNQPETIDIVMRKEENKPTLFFFHGDYFGGGLYIRKIAKSLPGGFNLIALHPFGQPGLKLPTTIENMAEDYLKVMLTHQKNGPYYLTGHCNGALLAYETARLLTEKGKIVGGVFLLDPATPGFNTNAPCTEEDIRQMTKEITPDDLKAMDAKTRSTLLLNVYRKICRGYNVKPYTGYTVLILGNESRTVTEKLADGWQEKVQALETILVPGGHHTMITEHGSVLADELYNCLMKSDNKFVEKGISHFLLCNEEE